MDDYSREIADLKSEIEQLREAEVDLGAGAAQSASEEITELEMQLEILSELYRRARELLLAGERDEALRRALKFKGYGDWSLENVYAYVYEQAVDLPAHGHHAFVDGIRASDFVALLAQPSEP